MNKSIAEAIREGILIFLLALSLIGYIEAQWPWTPEHESKPWVESAYWEVERK